MNNNKVTNKPFSIEYKETISAFSIKEHYHNAHEIVFITEGEVEFEISGKNYRAKKNSILFINNFEAHKNKLITFPYKRYLILVSQDFAHSYITNPLLLSILKQRPEKFKHMINVKDNCSFLINSMLKNIINEYNEQRKQHFEVIGNYLNLILINIYRNYEDFFFTSISNSTLEMINKVQKHIEENYLDEISLENTAKAFHMDMYYLSRLFKKVTGFTFKDYLIYQRLSKAKDLLVSTTKSVTEVCISSGFNNVNHFIRIFKIKEGITPLKFRKKIRES